MILVDTCIWSLALRRLRRDLSPHERHLAFTLRDLIISGEACLIGPIRQELLSGIPSPSLHRNLRRQIEAQPDLPLTDEVWYGASEFFNTCRSAGIAADAIDMTIGAAAHVHGASIFTVDPDFPRYARHLPITLFST
jgi:predicted nucleic acid-binding protein